jgi:DNA invertase Pin-like site-specific DNA recombinase
MQAKPRIWGYARVSLEEQQSIPMQVGNITAKCKFLEQTTGGAFAGIGEEKESAVKVRWNERPVLKGIIAQIQPGDHLVVWRLDRIERGKNMYATIDAIRWFVDHDIHLHSLNEPVLGELDLTSAHGQLIIAIMAWLGAYDAQRRSEATKQAMAWRKEHGLPIARSSYGKKIVHLPPKPGETRVRASLVWDAKECSHIRELVHRHEVLKESLPSIGKSFYDKNYRTAKGRLWVRMYHARGKGHRLNLRRIYEVYHWYCKQREAGTLAAELMLTGMEGVTPACPASPSDS